MLCILLPSVCSYKLAASFSQVALPIFSQQVSKATDTFKIPIPLLTLVSLFF